MTTGAMLAWDAETVAETVAAPTGTGPILVATDGRPESDKILQCARELVVRTGVDVQIISAVEPTSLTPPGRIATEASAAALRECIDVRLALVDAQLRRVVGPDTGWPVMMTRGGAADVIARAANERNATLIVCGRQRHGLFDRLAGADTVLQALQTSSVPVLAINPRTNTLARRAVLAVDFSEHSVAAAARALSLIAEDACVYLVHVASPLSPGRSASDRRAASYEAAMRRALEQVRHSLDIPATMTVECILLRGRPGSALLSFARASCSDLMVVGSHGQSFVDRLIIGSVASLMVRTAPCSVLCVPEPLSDTRLPRGRIALTRTVESRSWGDALRDIVGRWRGKRVRLVVHAANARPQESEGLLEELECDASSGEISVRLGSQAAPVPPTALARVVALKVDTDEDGSERGLSIDHAGFETTLIEFVEERPAEAAL